MKTKKAIKTKKTKERTRDYASGFGIAQGRFYSVSADKIRQIRLWMTCQKAERAECIRALLDALKLKSIGSYLDEIDIDEFYSGFQYGLIGAERRARNREIR